MPADLHTQPRHPIQVVSRRTGLSADVIRVWERRYGVVEPRRTSSSRRLYSDAEVERLALLRRVTRAGRRISDVVGLSDAELQAMVAEDEQARAVAPPGALAGPEAGRHLTACLDAVERMDAAALDAALERASVALSVPAVLEEVLVPLLREVGDRWRDGTLRVAAEHMASARLRTFLGGLRRRGNPDGIGPVLLLATPPGQGHELGTLMAAVIAAGDGWNAVHLGTGLPAEELAAAAARTAARAVALGITVAPNGAGTADELERLRAALPEGVPLLVGGAGAAASRDLLSRAGARYVATLADLRLELARIRETR